MLFMAIKQSNTPGSHPQKTGIKNKKNIFLTHALLLRIKTGTNVKKTTKFWDDIFVLVG